MDVKAGRLTDIGESREVASKETIIGPRRGLSVSEEPLALASGEVDIILSPGSSPSL